MKKNIHKKSQDMIKHLRLFSLLFFLLATFAFNLSAQVILNTEVLPETSEDEISIAVTVDYSDEIAAFQFSLNWDIQSLIFNDIIIAADLPSFVENSFNSSLAENGELGVVWANPQGQGIDFLGKTTLFVVNFTKRTEVPSNLYFDNTPVQIEFSNTERVIGITSTANDIVLSKYLLQGKVLFDENGNCAEDTGEKGLIDWLIEIKSDKTTRYVNSGASGDFAIYLPFGDFAVKAIPPPNNYFEPCNSVQNITISEDATDATSIAFTGKANIACPSLNVEIAVPFLRRCFENTYTVAYSNRGSIAETEAAYITVELDPFQTFVSSTIPATNVSDNIYRFEIGQLAVSEKGQFYITVKVDCETTELGQTHCVTAKIFPDKICETPANWSGANLELESECVDDKVHLRIKNTGLGDMDLEQEFIVVEDMIMLRTANPHRFQLESGAVETIEYPANGATYRLATKQVPNHPIEVPLATAIEGCGTNEDGTFSKGIINMFDLGDDSQFVDEDCQENRGAYDPNDKNAFPQGYNTAHFIDPNTDLTYHIRFQNTGTDTAFNIVVLDTLSELLDVSTIVPLVSSHPYEWSIVDSNILKYSFENIMLPDSNVNLVGSNGFFKFKISQKQDVEIGSIIENSAAIYFDFNAPIITNTYFHTVGFDFVEFRVITSVNDFSPVHLKISPNPMIDVATIRVDNPHYSDGQFDLYDLQGRKVKSYEFSGNAFELQKGELPSGLYLFEVRSRGELLGTGKVMIQE